MAVVKVIILNLLKTYKNKLKELTQTLKLINRQVKVNFKSDVFKIKFQ